MKKIAYKILPAVVIFSIMLVLPLKVSAQGSVKGISDALKKYKQETATPSSLKEIKKDFRDLNLVRSQLSQEVVKKQQEFLAKSKEEIIKFLGNWSEFLKKVEEELINYDQTEVFGLKEKIEEEI